MYIYKANYFGNEVNYAILGGILIKIVFVFSSQVSLSLVVISVARASAISVKAL